jgi:Tol biopolymer transport system component
MGKLAVGLAVLLAGVSAAAPAAATTPPGRADLRVRPNPFLVGQAPDWLDGRTVVYHDPTGRDEGGDGQVQIWRARLNGSARRCLTCGLPGPNQVPAVRPGGRWILFHSWSGHAARLGGPGFGGIGSDVWVMTRDGRRRTNLTASGELNDNFHAYWSPDGRWIAWTSLNWNGAEGGTGRSDVRVARFDPNGPRGPRLVDEHVVRPPNGHWYETQWWAPDGSGFLYTETTGRAINPELFFCRLPSPAHGRCRPSRLTHNPAWDEQALFTPDMRRVLFMSSRGLPGAYDDWSRVARFLELPARYDYLLVLSVFSESFLQPVLGQATDLYAQDVRWSGGRARVRAAGAPRRITSGGRDGWIVPEFALDHGGRRVLWTENRFPSSARVDQGCLMRSLRNEILARLSGAHGVGEIPFGLSAEIRNRAAELLADPTALTRRAAGCGGEGPPAAKLVLEQRTRIGRLLPEHSG